MLPTIIRVAKKKFMYWVLLKSGVFVIEYRNLDYIQSLDKFSFVLKVKNADSYNYI